MICIRYENSSTGANEEAIIKIMEDGNTKKVTFFASPREKEDPNAPLVSALAEYDIPGAGTVKIVYDGLFLTAQRPPRYNEVKSVVDVAIDSGKAYFAKSEAPFTEGMKPREAVSRLEEIHNTENLTSDTRANYFRMLSDLP